MAFGRLPYPSKTACHWTQQYGNAFVTVLDTHCLATLMCQTLAPSCTDVDTSWEDGDKTR
jgi:hypothetical protein